MKCKFFIFIQLLSTLLISNLTFAQTTIRTEIDNQSILKKIIPDSISHFSIFNGPSLTFDSQPNEFDGSSNQDGISSWHQVSLRYQLTKDTRFAINPRFTMNYNQVAEGSNSSNFEAKLDNPVMGIDTTWYKKGNFSWTGSLNTVFWVFTEDDKRDQLLLNPGGFQTFNFKLSDKVNAGTWFWARYRYFANNDERSKMPTFIAPYYSYKVNDKSSLTAFYQIDGEIEKTNKLSWDDNEHFNLLYSYRINKTFTIQPIVTLFRETGFNLTEGNLNLWLSGSFL